MLSSYASSQYCIAFGVDGASDVTRSYVSDWQETLARRDPALDRSLRDRLAKLTEDQRKHRSAEERRALCEEDAAEEQWLSDWKARAERARQESLSGRTSGTKEWRSMRLELGGDTSADALPAMARK